MSEFKENKNGFKIYQNMTQGTHYGKRENFVLAAVLP